MDADGPVAILAGGAGGVAVADHLARLVPREDVLLLADQAYAPYAARPPRVVADRVLRLADDLLERGAKLLVLASAAATGDALPALRDRLGSEVPVIGLDGGLRRAAAVARGGSVVAVVGAGCLRGGPHARAVRRLRGAGTVTTVAWEGLRELVENGAVDSDPARDLVRRHVDALRSLQPDVICLACAHAAAVAPLVMAAGGGGALVDAAAVAADQAHATLVRSALLAHRRRPGRRMVLTSWPDRASGLARAARRPATRG